MDDIKKAVHILQAGGVIAYPTETVFGLGCDPDNTLAIKKLLAIKQRPEEKGLILIASDFAQLKPYLLDVDDDIAAKAFSTWPGPYTWLWPAKKETSTLLRGQHDTLAVRVSAHPIVRELCQIFNKPLISTSANKAGEKPAQTGAEVKAAFADELDYILEGATGNAGLATGIQDLVTGNIIR
ncbi:MAG: L-threonylcarbamoyladenylate synthase [Gammaproteobacteria bacterium]|nr:L-threonylcarbamoyladenylate synthase [Gammaproteobacteria bacterium]